MSRTLSALLAGILALSVLASAPVLGEPAPRPRHASLQVATFNILGSQHTAAPGGRPPGRHRVRVTSNLIVRKGIDLVGLQEVQADQLMVLKRRLTSYRIWPAFQLGRDTVRLQIAWRERAFELVDTGTLFTNFDHQARRIPWVLLRHRASDRRIYVVDVHNSPRNQERERDRATGRIIDLVKKLRRTGRGLLLLGDMNERREVFCKVVARTDLRAANGGYVSRRRCRPPRPMRIDWIFGRGPFRFRDYEVDAGRSVRWASDHRLIRATVRVRVGR